MSDLITLSGGSAPYAPPSSEFVEVYNEYDGPLLGVIRQEGMLFLFDCIYGHVESLSLWLYTHITPADVDLLDGVDGEAFEELKRNVQCAAPARVALAIEGVGIVTWADAIDFPKGMEATLRELIDRYQNIQRRLTQTQGEVDELANDPSQLVCA